MGKLDELLRSAGGNAAESMGGPRTPTIHRASAPAAAAQPDRLQGITRSKGAAEIPVDKIGPDPDQPREEFDEEALRRLAESLRTRGQLQPIRVRWDEGRGLYAILCGERRWRAAALAGLPTMSCVIVDGPLGAGELLALQLIENLVREDLRPIEQARAYRQLMELNNWSARQVARELAVTQSSVVRALALLDLPEGIQDQVEQGTLAPATAYEVSKLEDSAEQVALAERVVAGEMTRDDAAAEVRRRAGQGSRKGRGRARRLTSRVLKTPTSKVTVELRKGEGLEAILAAVEEAGRQLRAELGSEDQAAA